MTKKHRKQEFTTSQQMQIGKVTAALNPIAVGDRVRVRREHDSSFLHIDLPTRGLQGIEGVVMSGPHRIWLDGDARFSVQLYDFGRHEIWRSWLEKI